MRKQLFTTALALLLCAGLAACGKAPSQSSGQSSSAPSQGESQSSGPEQPVVDDLFVREAVLDFGGELAQNSEGKEIVRIRPISLYNMDALTRETVTPRECFSWYHSHTFREKITDEERMEKYQNPNGKDLGWFFPAEYYEPAVMAYFGVTQDFLREDENYYDKALNGYLVGGGGGKGELPEVVIDSWSREGDTVTIHLTLAYELQPREMVLTVRANVDGSSEFLSYLPKA